MHHVKHALMFTLAVGAAYAFLHLVNSKTVATSYLP